MSQTPSDPTSSPVVPDRRGFLGWLTYILGAVAATLVTVPFVGYLLGAIRKTEAKRINLGPANGFPQGETVLVNFKNSLGQSWDGITAQAGVFVRYEGKDASQQDQFLVLDINCAHLGCPVSWFPESGLFLCPCHGGVYYANGAHASGPPPRGLYPCRWQVSDGQLQIQAPHYPTLQDTLTGKTAAVRSQGTERC